MDKLPVTLLTGFLGSGKTTLLNALLKRPELARTAVVINEFGEIGIDHLLVERGVDNVLLLDGGCLCCTVTTTLSDTLTELLGKVARGEVPAFVRVVVETTGLAEPEPIVRQLWVDAFMRERFALDAIVVTVDAVHAVEQLARHAEARRQAAAADRIVLTKTDLVEPRQREAVEAALDEINPGARRLTADAARTDPASVIDVGLLAGPGRGERIAAWLAVAPRGGDAGAEHLRSGPPRSGPSRGPSHPPPSSAGHPHTERFVSVALTLAEPVSWEAIAAWTHALRAACGAGLLRCKGIVDVVGEQSPVVLQGVAQAFHPPVRLAEWPAGGRRTRIVVICEGVSRSAIEATLAVLSPAAPGVEAVAQ